MSEEIHSQARTIQKVESGSRIMSLETGTLKTASEQQIQRFLEDLKANQLRWAQTLPLDKKIKLLEKVIDNMLRHKDEWIALDLKARKIPEGHPENQVSKGGTAMLSIASIERQIQVLRELEKHGGQKPFVKARQYGDRVIVESFPMDENDASRFPDIKAEIHLKKGTKVDDLAKYQAKYYKDKEHKGGICLILAAGNIASLVVTDLLEKMFVEKKVAIVKNNPVLEYHGPLMEKIWAPLIEEGVLRVVNGGAQEGRTLVNHPLVDEIHMTGSDKTFDAIVYGPGEQGKENKKTDHRLVTKPVSAELGNVSPAIIVPGEWNEEDYDRMADLLTSWLMRLNGYACNCLRVIVLPPNWDGSEKLMKKFTDRLSSSDLAIAYYPGTEQTFADAKAAYPDAKVFETDDPARQPIMLVEGLDAKDDEVAFKREFWGTFASQVFVEGDSVAQYLENAVKFSNEKLWGTLSASIFVDPKTEKELEKDGVLSKAIDDLRYGTVAINERPGFVFALGTQPWGAFPGSTYDDIQSGNSFIKNIFMLDGIEKSIVFAPFRPQ